MQDSVLVGRQGSSENIKQSGSPGSKGEKGDTGKSGEHGRKGSTGQKGEKGYEGKKGERGSQVICKEVISVFLMSDHNSGTLWPIWLGSSSRSTLKDK